MCFELTDASIAVNNADALVAVGGRMLDFSLASTLLPVPPTLGFFPTIQL
jgi:hypothetical protein